MRSGRSGPVTWDPDAIRDDLHRFYDETAKEFSDSRYKPWPEAVEFASCIEQGAQVLDIACGNGRNLALFLERTDRVVGLDIAARLLDIARSRHQSAGFVQGQASALPFREGTFDAVLFIAAIHHLPSDEIRQRSLSEIHRVLRPGGTALISAWDLGRKRFADGEVLDSLPGSQHTEGGGERDMFLPWKGPSDRLRHRYFHLFTEEEFRSLVTRAGFDDDGYFWATDNHYALLKR